MPLAQRVEFVKAHFPELVADYDAKSPFRRTGQLEAHLRTIAARRSAGSVRAALAGDSFSSLLYITLQKWGIGKRRSNLVNAAPFAASLRRCGPQIEALERDGPDPERIAFKLEFYDLLLEHVEEERAEGKHLVVAGDWDTAHTEIDLARPNENEGQTGFLPIEREARQRWVGAAWVDTFRLFHRASAYAGVDPRKRPYTWWTYRAGARDRNVGWRIDYHFVIESCYRAFAVRRSGRRCSARTMRRSSSTSMRRASHSTPVGRGPWSGSPPGRSPGPDPTPAAAPAAR